MPNGGVHRERVGVCPHCRNPRIRTRRRQHRRTNWRCRNCNRVFAAPSTGIVVVEEWPGVDLVYLDRIQGRQTGGSRSVDQGGRGNFGCVCLFIILIIAGVASFFAVSRNADFPGAQILRTAGQEVNQRLGGNGTGEEEQSPVPTLTGLCTKASNHKPVTTRLVRRHLWMSPGGFSMSRRDSDSEKVPAALYDRLTDTPTYAARMYKVQPNTHAETRINAWLHSDSFLGASVDTSAWQRNSANLHTARCVRSIQSDHTPTAAYNYSSADTYSTTAARPSPSRY